MHPHDPLVLPLTDDLVARWRLILRFHHRIVHRREIRLVHLDILFAELLYSLRFRHANAADLRVREHDRRDVRVIELRVLELRPAEEPVPERAAGGDGHRCQFDFAAYVAEGVDVLDGRVLVVVRNDVALFVLRDAGFVEAEVFDFRGAADGPEDAVEVHGRPVRGRFVGVVQLHPARVGGVFLELGLRGVAVDVDALALVLGDDGFLDHGVEGAEEGVVADEEVRFAAEVVEHAGHFDGDVAGADEGDALRQGFEVEEAVRRDAELGAGDVLRDVGVAASCDEDFFGADDLLGSIVHDNFGGVLVKKVGAAVEVFDFVVVEVTLVDAIEAFNVIVSLVLEGLEVERGGLFDVETVSGGLVEGFGDGGGVPGNLFGDASTIPSTTIFRLIRGLDIPNIDACTAQSGTLHRNGFSPPLPTRSPGTGKPATASTDDEEITFFADGSHDCRRSREVS